jgi:hypothetical protein
MINVQLTASRTTARVDVREQSGAVPAELRHRWIRPVSFRLDARSLMALLRNEIPLIRVAGFLPRDLCARLADDADRGGFSAYEGVYPTIGRIGITQFEHRDRDKRLYFMRATQAIAHREAICASSVDPLAACLRAVDLNWPFGASIAREPELQMPYFAGLIRRIDRSALLHADFAPHDAPAWSIGAILAQLSWNVFLRTPDSGGTCIVHDRQWEVCDERHKGVESYGYDSSLVRFAGRCEIEPTVGDLVLFNSRNFHEVRPATGDRITASSFIGLLPSGELVLWS